MLAKIINNETKQCDVFLGTDTNWAIQQGFSEMNVEKAYNGYWYVAGYAPEKPAPTHEEIREMRAKAFTEEADPLKYDYEEDCARFGPSSKEAIHSKLIWLEKKDEIRERYPYPVEE